MRIIERHGHLAWIMKKGILLMKSSKWLAGEEYKYISAPTVQGGVK